MAAMSYKQVAERLGLPVGTVYALVHQKRIPHVRLGSRLVRFDADAIEQWLQAHSVKENAPRDPLGGGPASGRPR